MTSAQRARLVVALGILNLALATMAFAVGTFGIPTSPIVGPAQPSGNTAVGQSPGASPSPAATEATSAPSASETASPPPMSPSTSPTGSVPPTPSSTITAVNPSIAPANATPTVGPTELPGGGTPGPTEPTAEPATAPPGQPTPAPTASHTPPPTAEPTPTARPTRTPAPTARPTSTPRPTASPTHSPTPTDKPKPKPTARDHPPCPQDSEGPPGHNKTSEPKQPCGHDKGKKGSGKDHGHADGVILVVPFLGTLLGLSSRAQRRLLRRRYRRAGADYRAPTRRR